MLKTSAPHFCTTPPRLEKHCKREPVLPVKVMI